MNEIVEHSERPFRVALRDPPGSVHRRERNPNERDLGRPYEGRSAGTALQKHIEWRLSRRGPPDGLATEAEEAVLGECGAAARVVDAAGDLAGAIGPVVPSTDWPLPPAALDALRSTARATSRELGAQVWQPPSGSDSPAA